MFVPVKVKGQVKVSQESGKVRSRGQVVSGLWRTSGGGQAGRGRAGSGQVGRGQADG